MRRLLLDRNMIALYCIYIQMLLARSTTKPVAACLTKAVRSLRIDAPLHPSVIERLKTGKVLNYDTRIVSFES